MSSSRLDIAFAALKEFAPIYKKMEAERPVEKRNFSIIVSAFAFVGLIQKKAHYLDDLISDGKEKLVSNIKLITDHKSDGKEVLPDGCLKGFFNVLLHTANADAKVDALVEQVRKDAIFKDEFDAGQHQIVSSLVTKLLKLESDKTIKQLDKDIKELKALVIGQEGDLGRTKGENDSLKKQNKILDVAARDLKAMHDSKEKEITGLKDELTTAQKAYDDLSKQKKADIQKLQADILKKSREIEDAKARATTRNTALQSQNAALSDKCTELSTQLAAAQKSDKDHQDEIQILSTQAAVVQQAHDAVTLKLQQEHAEKQHESDIKHSEDLQSKHQKIESLNKTINDLQQQIQELTTQLTQVKGENSKLTTQVDKAATDTQATVSKTQSVITELKHKVEELTTTQRHLLDERKTLNTRIATMEAILPNHEHEYADLSKANQMLTDDFKRLQGDAKTDKERATIQITTLASSNSQLQQEIARLQAENAELRREVKAHAAIAQPQSQQDAALQGQSLGFGASNFFGGTGGGVPPQKPAAGIITRSQAKRRQYN